MMAAGLQGGAVTRWPHLTAVSASRSTDSGRRDDGHWHTLAALDRDTHTRAASEDSGDGS